MTDYAAKHEYVECPTRRPCPGADDPNGPHCICSKLKGDAIHLQPEPIIDMRATPVDVFGPLNDRFNFSIDVAASSHNAKCSRFITKDEDGLRVSWSAERVWCNPPFSNIGAWVEKAWYEWSKALRPQVIVMLLPATRTDQGWWHAHVEPFLDRPGSTLRTEFIRDRIRFVREGAKGVLPNERPRFGCVLLIWSAENICFAQETA